MAEIKVHDKLFIPYISEVEIVTKIKELAGKLNEEYSGKNPLFIGVLNGAFMFAAELFKHISCEAEISFIKLTSYKDTQSTGQILTAIGLEENVQGRHVIILEDIIDTGNTMSHFMPQILHQQPASLKLASLLYKPDATVHKIKIDYNCFVIPDKFVVGFGLDYNGHGRNMPAIYQLR